LAEKVARAFACAARWQTPYGGSTVGYTVLSQRGLFLEDWWRWISIAVLLGFALLFNVLILMAQTYLNRELLHCCSLLFPAHLSSIVDLHTACFCPSFQLVHVHMASSLPIFSATLT
jgi:hypothetical protein